jgi:hypothetical protein
MIGVFSLLSIIIFYLVFHYTLYIKNKRIYKLVAKYKSRKQTKPFFIYIITCNSVSLAGTITVYLNGGEILGTEIK